METAGKDTWHEICFFENVTRFCKSNIHKQLTLKYNSNFCIQVHFGMCRSFMSLLLCTIGILGTKMLQKWNSYANSVKICDRIEFSGDSLFIPTTYTMTTFYFGITSAKKTACNKIPVLYHN